MKLSIIIPAYNEFNNLSKLYRVMDFMEHQPWFLQHEIIVVDDGSTDDTYELLKGFPVTALQITHSGKAAALMAGIRAADGDWLLLTDMDQATPIQELIAFIHPIDWKMAKVIIGSRGMYRAGAPIQRYILAWGQVVLRYLLTGLPYLDTQCGFKAVERSAALDILDHLVLFKDPSRSIGPNVSSGFDVEFLFVARRLGYRVIDTAVNWHHQETRRVHALRDAWRGTLALIGIFAARFSGRYPQKAWQVGRFKISWGMIFFFLLLLILTVTAVKP